MELYEPCPLIFLLFAMAHLIDAPEMKRPIGWFAKEVY